MTDQMSIESFGEYFIDIAKNPETLQNTLKVNYILNHVSCLDLLLQFLPDCPPDTKILTYTFLTIYKWLKNRGGLLDVEFLEKQISYLLNFIESNVNILTNPNNNTLLQFYSDAIAYSYRFLFESTIPQSPPFVDLFTLFNNPNNSFKIIALSIMKSVIFAMKDIKLKHMLETQQEKNLILFQRTHFSPYFKTAADIVLNNNNDLLEKGLDLLDSCFQIFAYKTDSMDIDRYFFNPPPDIMQYYQNNDNALPSALLKIFEFSPPESNREHLSMESLIYFASANESVWLNQQLSQVSFLVFTASRITNLINSSRCQKSAKSLHATSRLIFKLAAMKIPVVRFFQANQQVAVDFFVAVRDLTIFAFQECLMDESSNYLIKFWSQIVNCRFNASALSPEFLQLFPVIFNAYIDALGNHDDASIIVQINEIVMSQYIESSRFLWIIASISPQACANYIASALNNSTQLLLSKPFDQFSKSILCKIIYLILIISAHFLNRISVAFHDEEFIQKNIILITAVYNLIDITNGVMPNLIQSARDYDQAETDFTNGNALFIELLAKAELALKWFTNSISRDFFVQQTQNIVVDKILMNLPMCPNLSCDERKQFLFDTLFNRFLQDFKMLDVPELLSELLKFIDSYIFKGTKDIKMLSQNNALLQSLIQRKFFVEFKQQSDTVSISDLYKLLNKLYVRSIQTVEQFEAFLPYFDQRFAQLKASNYQDAQIVYILYSELRGALKGNGVPNLYYFLFHWFMTHVEDTISCILSHNNNPIVVESICKAWISICSNKGKQLILPKHSAEGIKLFQCSLRVIQALISAGDVDMSDRKKFIIKIIAPSISSKNNYVNFGIMEYFNDDSFKSMVEIFFVVICNWQVQVSDDKKMIVLINSIIQSIIQIKPILISDEEKFSLITQFLYRAASKTSDQVLIKDVKEIFDTLTSLMELFIAEDNIASIATFRPHFIEIIDLLINSQESITDKVSTPLYYMLLYDGQWVSHAFDLIFSLFDEKNREEIAELFKVTFTVDFSPPKENGIKQLRQNLMKVFKKNILKYTTSIYDIQEFSEMSKNLI